MVGGHRERSPRFSYGMDFHPSGVFSYQPSFWPQQRPHGGSSRVAATLKGKEMGKKEMLMIGGAVLGVVAVGALVWMAAKKN